MKGCSPYDEVIPEGNKGSSLEPSEGEGVWKLWLMPGTDTSFRQAHEAPACFEEARKIDYLRELDKVRLTDGGWRNITLLAKLRENRLELYSREILELKTLLGDRIDLEGLLAKIEASIGKIDQMLLADLLTVICVWYVFLEDDLKIVDRPWLELYTKVMESVEATGDFVGIIGKKPIESEVLLSALHQFQAKQIITLEDESGCTDWVILRSGILEDSSCEVASACWKELTTSKTDEVGLGESGYLGYGYNQGGYNIGAYM